MPMPLASRRAMQSRLAVLYTQPACTGTPVQGVLICPKPCQVGHTASFLLGHTASFLLSEALESIDECMF